MQFASEDDLRDSFIDSTPSRVWASKRPPLSVRSVRETTCSAHSADWLWAGIHCTWPEGFPQAWSRLLRHSGYSRLIALLRDRGLSREELAHRSDVTYQTFQRSLNVLLEAHLIQKGRGERYRLAPEFRLPKIELCAFEFKLTNYRKAFFQAYNYRWFSHRTYVVMPADLVHRVSESMHESYERFNIGLISHSADGDTKVLLPSKIVRRPVSLNYIQALGHLLDHELPPRRRVNPSIASRQSAKC